VPPRGKKGLGGREIQNWTVSKWGYGEKGDDWKEGNQGRTR